ncbi:hypothetical protein BJI69_17035 [Luteibacter rhizovicinus DSM 16549]|uniref:Uncharacterized protein n=1 Tax=Luteibacter rhizovicinus DSM 16549 TaxID=1440763 RepID=A0A0G9GYN2_9GAMM|nr:hypothetical protein [Luteibacter rhizovicinus]APG05442.1 hypothetical protein BJI69_17035 [Luteibacter rhizovicinus DSM 16549]KLD62351.1 hypothetical protein Y883_20610 [Luteibacter rhizovicinus DSM 16549]
MSSYNEFPLAEGFVAEVGAPPHKLTHGTVSTISGPGVTSVNVYPYTGLIVVGNNNGTPVSHKPATARFTPPSLCSEVRLGFPANSSILPGLKVSIYDDSDKVLRTYEAPHPGDVYYEAEAGKSIKFVEVEATGTWAHIASLIFYRRC